METKIKIEGLQKKFGEFTAVDCLNFDIYSNEIFGLLGPNGAGKTTTINMICGLLPPTEGKITFLDFQGAISFHNTQEKIKFHNTQEKNTFHNQKCKDHKSLIGYCPQENIFYPKLTCLEQLLFIGQMYGLPLKEVKARAVELLSLMGLGEKTNKWANSLSGGMKRRLNICLALIHNPGILILDEPEAGLDPQSRILVRDFIKAFGKEKTIILTTHNMDEADRLADRVAIMDHGKLLMLDTPQNLKRTIGEGDILELVLEKHDQSAVYLFAESVAQLSMKVKISADCVLIKHKNIVEQLPAIKNLAETNGLSISEIKLRETTLEDVFIHLTGRSLRQ